MTTTSFKALESSAKIIIMLDVALIVCGVIPRYVNVRLVPGAASIEKLPSMSVIPTVLPLAVMVAPMTGSPEASFTCPLIAPDCAKELAVRSRPLARVNALRGNLNFTCFIICLIFKLMYKCLCLLLFLVSATL